MALSNEFCNFLIDEIVLHSIKKSFNQVTAYLKITLPIRRWLPITKIEIRFSQILRFTFKTSHDEN
jgi:hypothetical protein